MKFTPATVVHNCRRVVLSRLSFLSNHCTSAVPVFSPKYSDEYSLRGYYRRMLQEPLPVKAKPARKILLYGNSILIAGLASKLEQVEGLDVAQANDENPGDLSGVDVIVVDLRNGKTSQSLPRLCSVPGVMLVGLDAITNTLTVLTSQSHPANSMQDVLDVLRDVM